MYKGGFKRRSRSIESSRFDYMFSSDCIDDEPSPSPCVCKYGPPKSKPRAWKRDEEANNRIWRKLFAGLSKEPKQLARKQKTEKKKKPKPEIPKQETPKRLLVKEVDLHVAENTKNHKTDCYERTEGNNGQPAELVLRRGQFVKITITFDRPYVKEKHDMKLMFTIGKKNSPSKGTKNVFKVDEDGKKAYNPFQWGAYLESQSGNSIVVMVQTPADCIVGSWDFSVLTFVENPDKTKEDLQLLYKHNEDIAVLFNPWCEHDTVYMKDSDLLNEYILNESGCVFRGSKYQQYSKSWNLGQFEDDILEICLFLLREAFGTTKTMVKAMADPVKVSRKIVAILNSPDDGGVLVGNWSGEYEGGTSPLAWNESPKILRKFYKDGPVKFGQCWVFSCLTTTVFRCLGIPCRTVTNFASAHDTDETCTIDKVTDVTTGKEVAGMNDSVWNFHVWNEVWMTRPDLEDPDFGGWQVLDATPQEMSEGVYTCGPCPVAAIKKGQIRVNYDAPFIFSEVNADQVFYKKYPDETIVRQALLTGSVGKFISTKKPDGKPARGRLNTYDRLDITDEYKYPDGSEEERAAVKLAYSLAFRKLYDPYEDTKFEDEIKLQLAYDQNVMIGQNMTVDVTAKNMGYNDRKVKQTIVSVFCKTYNGKEGPVFIKSTYSGVIIKARESETYQIVIKPEDYFDKLVEQAFLYVKCTCTVQVRDTGEPDEDVTKGRDVTFNRPELEVKGPKTAKVGDEVTFKVSFQNPLSKPLTKCDISMSSSGFKDIEDMHQNDVPAGGVYEGTFKMIPKRKNEHDVVFTFDSKELQDINGSISIVIT